MAETKKSTTIHEIINTASELGVKGTSARYILESIRKRGLLPSSSPLDKMPLPQYLYFFEPTQQGCDYALQYSSLRARLSRIAEEMGEELLARISPEFDAEISQGTMPSDLPLDTDIALLKNILTSTHGILILLDRKKIEELGIEIKDDPETVLERGKYFVLTEGHETFPLSIVSRIICLDEYSYKLLEEVSELKIEKAY